MHLMPTKNPRLTITISPSLSAQLRRVSQLTGHSQAGLISELLEGSGRVFDRLIIVLEAAEEARFAVSGELTEKMSDAQKKLEGQLGLWFADEREQVTEDLLKWERIKRRGSRKQSAVAQRPAASAASSTPPSNRGVRSGAGTAKKPAKSRG